MEDEKTMTVFAELLCRKMDSATNGSIPAFERVETMLKNIGLPAACLGVILLFGVASAAEVHDLMTEQYALVGMVRVENDADYLYVTLKSTGDRAMMEAHLRTIR